MGHYANKDIIIPDDINYYDEISCNKNIFLNISKIRKVVFPEKMSTLAVSFADTTLEEVVLHYIRISGRR